MDGLQPNLAGAFASHTLSNVQTILKVFKTIGEILNLPIIYNDFLMNPYRMS